MNVKSHSNGISKVAIPLSAFGLFIAITLPASARGDHHFAGFAPNHIRQNAHVRELRKQHEPRNNSNNDSVTTLPGVIPVDPMPNRSVRFDASHLAKRSLFVDSTGSVSRVSREVELDLNSTRRSIRLGSELFGGIESITITVGGETKTLNAGSLVTPSEYIAVQQSSDGAQQLVLDSSGKAVDGTLSLQTINDAGSKISASALVVPKSVDVIGDFANRGSDFRLRGDLINYGSVEALSNRANDLANISAKNILNGNGAVISADGLALNLSADKDFSNFGTIQTSHDLTISAGRNVTNAGIVHSNGSVSLVTADGGISNLSGAEIRANGDVNINSGTGQIQNAGVVASNLSNINLGATALATDVSINSTGGRFEALAGGINVRDSAYGGIANVSMNGGDYASQTLNIYSGSGTVTGYVGDVTGVVNVYAGSADFGADTSNLNLGNMCVNGDPTYFNTGGNLTLATVAATSGNNLALIASGNVTVTSGTLDTTRSASGGNAGTLTVIAGANVTPAGQSGNNDTSTVLTITQSGLSTHGSATGGLIDLSGVTKIDTSGNVQLDTVGGSGADILMIAFAGSGTDSGTINLGTTGSIHTYGVGRSGGIAVNGNVTLIAGAAADPSGSSAVIVPTIYSGSGPANNQAGVGGGNVTITTATPNVTGSVTYTNGTKGGAGSFSAGTLMPTSVQMGSIGGGATIRTDNPILQWQTDLNTYALTVLNNSRTTNGVAAVQFAPALLQLALLEAEYIASTGNFGHYDLRGGLYSDRASALGLSVTLTPDNLGARYGGGSTVTPKQNYDAVHASMMAEPAGQQNHRSQILDPAHKFAAVGMVNIGDAWFYAEVFSNADPGPVISSIPAINMHGGIGGQVGNVASSTTVTSLTKTLGTITNNSGYPVSILSAGGNVNITAGNNVNIPGFVIANGMNELRAFRNVAGHNGGNVTVSAGGDVNVGNIQSTGGIGGSGTGNGSTGGDGGDISVTSTNGDITIVPSLASPFIGVSAAGGAGGAAFDAGASGGNGGAGGNITLSATNGTVLVSAIEAAGGGGSGGVGSNNGTNANGGAGGAGGTINVDAQSVVVQYYVDASGGGGGGAGGKNSHSGGGGGGGSFGEGGMGGGTAGSSGGGGGGSGGGMVPGIAGASDTWPYYWMVTGNGHAGSSGAGGAGGTIGGGGGGGAGGTPLPNDDGGAGGGAGQAGNADANGIAAGGAAGAGGTVTLNGTDVTVQGTIGSFWGPIATTHTGSSVLALGPGGSVTITSATGGGSFPIIYSTDANYSSSSKSILLGGGGSFLVGVASGTNRTAGAVESGGTISINGQSLSSPVTSGSYGTGGSFNLSILEGGSSVAYTNGDHATPAELVALIQVFLSSGASQPLTLNASGMATGGDFTVSASNVPVGGFGTLLLPTGVILHDDVANLSYSGGATVNGSIQISTVAGVATISTPNLSVNGSITDSSGSLNIQGTGAGNALTLSMGPAGVISTTNGNVSFNGNASGPITTNTAQGTVTAGGAGNQVSFNGGTGAVNVSFGAINGPVNANGSSVAIATPSSALTIGAISSADISITCSNSILNGINIGSPTTLSLHSTGGDIGSVGTRFSTSAATITAISDNGSVYLQDTNPAGATIGASSNAQLLFDYLGAGPVTVNGASTDNGNINIVNTTGKLEIASGATVTANNGDILLQLQNPLLKKGKKSDVILFNTDSTVQALAAAAGVGNVTASIGAPVQLAGKQPKKNVIVTTTGSGQIFWGTRSVYPKKSTTPGSVQAKDATVTFSSPWTKKGITIMPGADIIGDPN